MEFKDRILKKSFIHDIEIFPNFFSDIFKIPGKKIIYLIIHFEEEIPDWVYDDIRIYLPDYDIRVRKYSFFYKIKNHKPFLISYNGFHYDDIILNAIISNPTNLNNAFLYELSKHLIGGGKSYYKYKNYFRGIDMMRVSGLDRIFKPLKQVASNLKHPLIQDLPLPFDQKVSLEDIPKIIKYELNDVLITEKLFLGIPGDQQSPTIPQTAYSGLMPGIIFREDIGRKWGIDFLNNNKSQIGEKLASKFYADSSMRDPDEFKNEKTDRELIKYSDVIFNNVKFKTKELQEFLEKLKALEYKPEEEKEHKKEFSFELNLFDLTIDFKQGGIHYVPNYQRTLTPEEDEYLREADAASYYPMLYKEYKIEPEHLPGFSDFVEDALNLRLEYKKAGLKVYANGIKIPLNRVYGGFGDKTGWLKDIQALLKTTINGQLFLLMLTEEFYINDMKPLVGNTDGIFVILKKEQEDKFIQILRDWEETTRMIIEDVDYSKYFLRDVNNYISIKAGGDAKAKGAYEYTSYIEKYGEFDVTGSFNHPVTSYAAFKYLTEGIPVKKTILNHKDIYDFCIAKKTGKQFHNELFTINNSDVKVESIQQSIRYYISKSNQKLYKVKQKSDTEMVSLLKKEGSRKLNNYILTKEPEDNHHCIYQFEDGTKVYVMQHATIDNQATKAEWLHYDDVCVNRNITLFNEAFFYKDWGKYNIDYDYYINEANKLVDGVKDLKAAKQKEIAIQQTLF